MGNLYENIDFLCAEHGVNVTIMCKDAGVSRAPLSDLKMGRSKTLSFVTMSKIADYFGITVDELVGSEQKEKPTENGGQDVLDEVDVAFYGEYRELNTDEKEVVRDMIRVMRERRAKKQGK